jgi:hypothetical protein
MAPFRFFPVFALFVTSIALAPAQSSPARSEFANASQPQLAVGTNGRAWLVYGRFGDAPAAPAPAAHADGHPHKGHQPQTRPGEVLVASSQDGGTTFSKPTKVASLPKLMLGNRRGPRIVAHGDRVTVTLIADELTAFTSNDGGKTWADPVVINEVPTCAREGLHDLAGSPDGQLFVTWLDLRNGKMELWGAGSQDGGRTWGKNEQIYRSTDKSICECCHPSALFDRDGNLAIMWRNSIEGARDMWFATRPKGAAQFTPARKIGEGTWKLNACPMDGGEILALGNGRFGAVWQRNGEVFVNRGEGPERKLGNGKQPIAVTAGTDGPVVIWQQGTSLVSLRSLTATEPVTLAVDARFPAAVALPGGKGALLAYERGEKGATSVTVERL